MAAGRGHHHPPDRREQPYHAAVGRGRGPADRCRNCCRSQPSAAAACLSHACRPTGRWRARSERFRLAAPRDLPLGAARRVSESGQVAAQGRAGRRTLLYPTKDGRASTFTLLHAAAAKGHLELVRELLRRGASVDLPSSRGLTALMEAAYHDHLLV
eukprot:scaffold77743_cov67-Phaeocystis_antarctica.AAC.2